MKPLVWFDPEQSVHNGSVDHPESPQRVLAIQALLNPALFTIKQLTEPISRIEEPASSHSWLLEGGDTYCTVYTPILLARGKQMIEGAVRELALGSTFCAFVCIRPPGHHANFQGLSSGFCYQNNVWIAVEQLLATGFHSIGIFDWDAHHGDGTEDCVRLAGDPNIRFASMHAFGPGIFPGTGSVSTDRILNIPLPLGTNSDTYLKHFHTQVVPFLSKGKPDILIISAGYDGHEKDPMNLLQLHEQTYAHMSYSLKMFDCPVLFLLEGGYNPAVLASCVEATLKPWIS